MDDPAQAILAEPRMLHTQDHEATWWRIVDVPKALVQRGYSTTAELVIKLAGDDLAPWNNGTWCLQTFADESMDARVTPVTSPPEVTLSIKTLTGLFSGMYDAQTLANWGMLRGEPGSNREGDCGVRDSVRPHRPDHYSTGPSSGFISERIVMLESVDPAVVGLSKDRLTQITRWLDAQVADGKLAGAST